MSDSLQPHRLQHTRLPCPSQSLLKFRSTGLVMLSNHLIVCHPLLLLPSVFPSIRVLSSESAFHSRWPKYWSFSFSISPSNEYSGLLSFRIDRFDLPAAQGTLKSFLQHHILRHQFFGTQPSLWYNSHICTWLLKKPLLWLYKTLHRKLFSLLNLAFKALRDLTFLQSTQVSSLKKQSYLHSPGDPCLHCWTLCHRMFFTEKAWNLSMDKGTISSFLQLEIIPPFSGTLSTSHNHSNTLLFTYRLSFFW